MPSLATQPRHKVPANGGKQSHLSPRRPQAISQMSTPSIFMIDRVWFCEQLELYNLLKHQDRSGFLAEWIVEFQ